MKKYLFIIPVLFSILFSSCHEYEIEIYDNNRVGIVVHYTYVYLWGSWFMEDSMVYHYKKDKIKYIDIFSSKDTSYRTTVKFNYKRTYILKTFFANDSLVGEIKLYPNENGFITKEGSKEYKYDTDGHLTEIFYSDQYYIKYEFNNSDLKKIFEKESSAGEKIYTVETINKKSNLNLIFPEYSFYGNKDMNLIKNVYLDTALVYKYDYQFDDEGRILILDKSIYGDARIIDAETNDTVQYSGLLRIKRTKLYYY